MSLQSAAGRHTYGEEAREGEPETERQMPPEKRSEVQDRARHESKGEEPRLPAPPSLWASWRTKLVLLVGVAIVVVATAVGASAYTLARDNLRDQIGERLEDASSNRAALFRGHIAELQREIALITSRTRLRALLRAHRRQGGTGPLPAEVSKILEDAQSSVDVIYSLSLLNPQGRVIGAADPEMIGADLSQRPAFVNAKEHSYLGLPTRTPGGGFRAPLVAPIRARNGELLALMWADVDMTSVGREVSRPLRGWTSGEVAIARQIDGKAEFEFRPSLETVERQAEVGMFPGLALALRGEAGRLETTDYRGKQVISAYRPIFLDAPNLIHGEWAITAKVDATEAYTPVVRTRMFTVWIAALLGLGAMVVAYWVALRLTAPIARLTQSALVTAADPSAPIDIPERQDEIGALAAAFGHMREELIAEKEALETRVAERTADLEAVNRQLTGEIDERVRMAEELREAKEDAEASSQAKSSFLAAMSHEIRTPMNGIIGMAELLATTPLAPIQREYLGMVQESAESLLQVINDILDFSRIEAGRLQLEERTFELREFLGNTVRTFADRAHKKGLELTVRIDPEVPAAVAGDPLRLRQVLVNLLGNAIRFTERGEVSVNAEVAERSGERVVLEVVVQDTGIGIPKARQAAIFEPFEQADVSSTRSYGGTGLGLTIAQRVVEEMGGSIEVESTKGEGSTFRFTVPFEVRTPVRPEKMLPPEALEGTRILVVDDNQTNRRILEEILSQWKMQPTVTGRGKEALPRLLEARDRGEPFHVVLLDVEMAEIDGFTLAEQLIADPRIGSPTILMLSSADRPGDVQRCKELGVEHYLLKPIKQSDLLEEIQRALGIRPISEPTDEEEAPMTPLRILVAEDNRVSQRLALELLQGWGHEVTVASSGEEVVEAFRGQPASEPFDIVLMDVQMPRMDGFEATGVIRGLEEGTGSHVPIVAMTAHAMKGDRERCLAAGMDGYLSKPIRAEELRYALERYAAAGEAPVAGGPPEQRVAPEVIDWSEALQHVEGREEVLRSMAQAFVEDCPSWVASIRDAVSRRDADALSSAAHSLKGAAQVMAASRVAEIAKSIEASGRSGSFDVAAAEQRELAPEVDSLLEALSDFVARGPGTPAGSPSTKDRHAS